MGVGIDGICADAEDRSAGLKGSSSPAGLRLGSGIRRSRLMRGSPELPPTGFHYPRSAMTRPHHALRVYRLHPDFSSALWIGRLYHCRRPYDRRFQRGYFLLQVVDFRAEVGCPVGFQRAGPSPPEAILTIVLAERRKAAPQSSRSGSQTTVMDIISGT